MQQVPKYAFVLIRAHFPAFDDKVFYPTDLTIGSQEHSIILEESFLYALFISLQVVFMITNLRRGNQLALDVEELSQGQVSTIFYIGQMCFIETLKSMFQ